jgi:membrane-associated phospholipid phosphatase
MSEIFIKNKVLYLSYILIIVLGLYPLKYEAIYLFLFLNKIHTKFLDAFLYAVSILGSIKAYLFFLIALVAIRAKTKFIITTIFTFLGVSLVVQIVKILTYSPRPITALPLEHKLKTLVDGISYAANYKSLPSGHAAIAFSLATLITIIFKVEWYKSIILMVLAALIAYSRVYLGFHFYIDIYLGGIIGIVISTLVAYIIVGKQYSAQK